jgi:GNAT superfamily N-acetyltransferase
MNKIMDNMSQEAIRSRQTQNKDYERIRCLLLETQADAPVGLNWDIRRLESKRWYDARSAGDPDWRKNSRLWETTKGFLVGWVHPDSMGYPYIEIHPDYRYLEGEMIAWAEEHFADDGRVQFFVYDYDLHRQKGLAKALMQEGLRRLKAQGAINVIVETGDMVPANRLYTSLGFTEMYQGHYWLLNKICFALSQA